MAFWGRKQLATPIDHTVGERAQATGAPGPLWTDSLGRLAIRCAQIFLVLLVTIAVVYGSLQLTLVLIPVLLALIIASAVRPFVRWMERHRIPSALATLIAMLSGLAVFGGIVTLVVNGVRSEWDTLVDAVTRGIDTVSDFLASGVLPIDAQQLEDLRSTVVDFVTSAEFGSGALAGVGNVVSLVTGLVLTVVILFYFMKDGPQIWSFLIRPLRPANQIRARRVGHRAVDVLGGYVTGTAIVAAVDAVVIGGALWILQVPLALPLAIIVFVGAFIPIVGATVAGIVAALVALVTNDLTTALIVGAVVIGVNQLEGNLLAPVVLGKSLRLHELVILLALTIGTILGGIVGTFLAVPFAAVGWAIIKAWNEPDAASMPAVPPRT
ncbi:MAG: family transporter [Homoserinimonas sp.]|jgi:predicted PurR-regulated permease PerM|nr:family transporter [Homoserinimonas sp.]